jgi:hypothetical protein
MLAHPRDLALLAVFKQETSQRPVSEEVNNINELTEKRGFIFLPNQQILSDRNILSQPAKEPPMAPSC